MVAEDGSEGAARLPLTFAFSETGYSHIQKDKPCQDSSFFESNERYSFACVADGHGGEDYVRSGIGSMLCCRAAYECMTDRVLLDALSADNTPKRAEQLILQLKKSLICRWNELVAEHMEANAFAESELEPLSERVAGHYRSGEYIERAYGTTLAAALRTERFCLVLQLGDGMSVISADSYAPFADEAAYDEPDDGFYDLEEVATIRVPDDEGEEQTENEAEKLAYVCPLPIDEKCVLNQTTSMCDSNALGEMRHYYVSAYDGILPDEIFLCTDGIANSFAGRSQLYSFYSMISENMREASDEEERDSALCDLWDFIGRLSQKGSGDDVSIAAILN